MAKPLTVLHVVESFGGGVATALAQYCTATPDLRHHLLRTERAGHFIDSGETDNFGSIADLASSPLRAMSAIRRVVKTLQPDVVHAHSSLAGLYVRLSLRAGSHRPIVYTPHGYAMERRDVSPVTRFFFGSVERVLSKNTSVYAACSPREQEISGRISTSAKVFYVPNVAPPMPVVTATSGQNTGAERFLVAATGRLTPARDPSYFASVVRTLRSEAPNIRFQWIGGGDPSYERELSALGVEVTGWLPRSEALQRLSRADLLLHTAAWDGFPMVLLEANGLGVPAFVRDIPAFDSVPRDLVAPNVEHLAQMVLTAAGDRSKRAKALEAWNQFLSTNTTAEQAERLRAAYHFGMKHV